MGLPLIGLPQGLRIYLAVEPVDMRKQYDGLWALASQHLGLDPKGGALFVFTNKNRDRVVNARLDLTHLWPSKIDPPPREERRVIWSWSGDLLCL